MSNFSNFRFSKTLLKSIADANYLVPTEIQSCIFPRINGGQNIVAIAPEGYGKTTALILAALNKIKVTEEIAPSVLYLVSDIPAGEEVIDQIHTLNRNRDLRILGLFSGGATLDTQVLELTDGVDIVVATPDRARAAYLKLGLNLNKLKLFIVDDADQIVKKGLTLPTNELARSLRKTQIIFTSTVFHDRLDSMIDFCIDEPNIIEIEEYHHETVDTVDQFLYIVPNFSTKLYLIELLLADKEVFDKTLVSVNSEFTSETLQKRLSKEFENEVLAPLYSIDSSMYLSEVESFFSHPKKRIFIASNQKKMFQLDNFKSIIHFDLPLDETVYLSKVLQNRAEGKDLLSIAIATELELDMIKRLERKIGKKMEILDLPTDLYIAKN